MSPRQSRLYLRLQALLVIITLLVPDILAQFRDNARPGWSGWGSWSECTRTCSLGIQSRTRQCSYQTQGSSSSGNRDSACVGAFRQLRTCNKQACPAKHKNFREEQCEKFNKVKYRGRHFRWKPRITKNYECQLVCQPKGYRFYLKLSNAVVDGTRCRPDDPYGICVAGKCKKVGCDGVLDSDSRFDKCGVCGGDNTTCHTVSGIFIRTALTYGYNKITTIPVGACNINITEFKPSSNYLALKLHNGKYIINGDYSVDFEDDYEAAGTVFKYKRPAAGQQHREVEHILAEGPLDHKVDVMLLKQHRNRGVTYSYTIPTGKENPNEVDDKRGKKLTQQDDSRRYRNRQTRRHVTNQANNRSYPRSSRPDSNSHPYMLRSENTGPQYLSSRRQTVYHKPGWQSPAQPHQRNRQPGRRRNPYYLTPGALEATGQRRTYRPGYPSHDAIPLYPPRSGPRRSLIPSSGAPYAWTVYGFTECTHSCGGGTQNTIIVCIRQDSRAIVTDDNCDNLVKPDTQSLRCNTRPCPPHWRISEWGSCSTSCDDGKQERDVTCQQRINEAVNLESRRCDPLKEPPSVRTCNNDNPCNKWQIGEWGRCSADCGKGQRTREVICINVDNQTVPENSCKGSRPKAAQMCDMGSCAKTWFYAQWSQCSSECGEGIMTRTVVCTGEKCNRYNRPHSRQRCKNDLPCGGRWFIGPWGECSVSCGKGVRKRPVACVKIHGGAIMRVVATHNCQHARKPEDEEQCSQPPCKAEWYTTDWTQCSRTCNTGFKTREIKCLDEKQEFSTTCTRADKPSARQTCNSQACPRIHGPASTCLDRHKNCVYIAQARLCQYAYYSQLCCVSCNSQSNTRRRT